MKTNLKSLSGFNFLKIYFFFNVFCLLFSNVSNGQVSQNFEGYTAQNLQGTCLYFDASTSTHILQNYDSPNCGLITVKAASSGTTLGFENLFTLVGTGQTGTSTVGFSDGDAFGVADNTSLQFQLDVNAIQGSKAFLMEDIDGDVLMRFDQVNLTGTTNPEVNLKYILASTSWETGDYLKVDVEISNCAAATTFNILDISGTGMTAVGTWNTLSANLTPYIGCAARLIIGHSSNASTEEMAIDDVNFTQGVVGTPPPAIICPTIGSNAVSDGTVCLNETFNITATGLNNMSTAGNLVSNFGVKFVAHPLPTSTPYTGGIDLGSVPFGSLTSAGTTASITGASLGKTGTFQVYAILDPAPTDGSCRPYKSASITVNGCPVSCNPTNGVSTSFETIVAQNLGGSCVYIDADNASVHQIQNFTNTCGPITVNYPGFGTTLGFVNILDPINTAQSSKVGFSDGDAFGVADNTSLIANVGASAPNGTQAFLMEDIDGDVQMKFDQIDLTGTTSPSVNLQYILSAATWEAEDFFKVDVEITGCGAATSLSLIDVSGTAIDDVKGNWNTLSANLTPYVGCTAELSISFSSDAASEELAIDNINFTEGCRAGSAPAIVCPTIGTSSSSAANLCINSPFDLNVGGLSNMNSTGNTDQDYGIKFVAFPTSTTTPYVGGTTLGTVPFANLTSGNSAAAISGATIGMTGDFYIYAVLSPTPFDGSCRPSSVTNITIEGCSVVCSGTIGTSFETIIGQNLTGSCLYIDADNTTIHELVNTNPACGPITVKYPSFGNTLGFKNVFDPVNTAQTTILGFSDGDAFGVANNTSLNFNLGSPAPDGSQAFLMEDIDGDVAMIFDEVKLTASSAPTVSYQYFISTAIWDNLDFFKSRVEITGCPAATTVSLINVSGAGMDDLEGSWRTMSADLTAYAGCTAQLVVEFSSNSSAEELGIDNVVFTNGCIVYPFVCPSIGSLTPSSANVCVNNSFDLTASGLSTFEAALNNEQDFGVEFRFFNDATSNPYSGGTSLGTVPFGSLSTSNSVATLVGATISNPDPTGLIYAVLSPAPTEISCRPFISTNINVNSLPIVTFTAPTDLCLNAGVQVTLGGGLPTGGVYSGPGVTDDGNGTTYSFDPVAAGVGSSTIVYTFTDINSCSNSASDDVEVFALPTVTFLAPTDLCVNTGVQVTLGGGLPTGGVYSGLGVTDDGNGTTYSFDPAAAGVGPITLVYTFTDGNSCSNSASDDVEVLALPTVTFLAPTDLCQDAGVQVALGGGLPTGGVYSGPGVTDDGNGTTYSFNPGAAGIGASTIVYTFTDGNSCSNSASDDVEVFALPAVSFTAPSGLCIDAGIQSDLGGGAASGGVYSGSGVTDDGNGSTYSFDPVVAGIGYHVISYSFTNTDGCTNFASDDIQVFAVPVITFSAPADLCLNAGIQTGLGGGISVGGVYNGPGVTDDGNGTTYSFDPGAAGVGVHILTYTYSDGNGCVSSASDNIEVFGVPSVTFIAPLGLCADASVQTGLGGGTSIGGVYAGPGVTDDGNGTTYSFNPALAGVGIHSITYTVTDGNSCTVTASDDIEVYALPIISFTAPADLCIDASIQTGLGGGTTTGGVYSGNGVTDDGNGTTFSFDPTLAGIGVSTITYSYTDGKGCFNSASDDIEVFPNIVVPDLVPAEFNDIYACENGETKIGLNFSNPSLYTYQWQVSTGGPFTNLTESTPYSQVESDTLDIDPSSLTLDGNQYRALVSNGCQTVISDTFNLKIGATPNITLQPVSQTVCPSNEAILEVGMSGSGVSFQWQIDNGSGFTNVSGSEYEGATTRKLIISNFNNGKSGKPFRCLVYTSCFQILSDPAIITISNEVTILSQPNAQSVCEFSTAQFIAQAVKLTPGALNYQWQRKSGVGTWTNINTGGRYTVNGNQLSIANIPVTWNGAEFRCLINDYCQTIPKTLNVIPVAHVIQNPVNQAICAGNNANFSIQAAGEGLTYRWQVNAGSGFTNLTDGGIYQGATSANLILNFPTETVNDYQYRCVVSGTSTCDLAADTSAVASISIGVSAEAQTISYNSDISTSVLVTQAVGYILGINKILQPNGKAEYRAGNSILLNPGFEVETGAVFKAKIQNPCQLVSTSVEVPGSAPKEKVK